MGNPNILNKFNEGLNAFYGSRLIIADRVISGFLQTLAQEPEFMAIIADCARTADFKQEYSHAIVNDENGLAFRLPVNKRHIVALVTGLLFQFDSNDISIIEFVRKFYPAEASHESYIAFCDNVLKPYGEAFRSVYLGEDQNGEVSSSAIDTPEKPFNDKAKEETDYWLTLALDNVVADNTFVDSHRHDATTMIKGLMYATELANPILIKLCWIGLKYVLGSRKSTYRELKEVESILITYGVID
ncbi:MAG: hypothetical protein J6R35_00340 [Clostridia bacterium]|nr:hypothetical protein [Clostridia bacterium]